MRPYFFPENDEEKASSEDRDFGIAIIKIAARNRAAIVTAFKVDETKIDRNKDWGIEPEHLLEVIVEPGFMWGLVDTVSAKLDSIRDSNNSIEPENGS